MERLVELVEAHERLKKRVHAYRLPIASKWGRTAMGCIYFLTPCVAGYLIMNASNRVRDANLGREGEREKLLQMRDNWGSPTATVVMARTPVPHKVDSPTRVL
jgi:hypothetical protein